MAAMTVPCPVCSEEIEVKTIIQPWVPGKHEMIVNVDAERVYAHIREKHQDVDR